MPTEGSVLWWVIIIGGSLAWWLVSKLIKDKSDEKRVRAIYERGKIQQAEADRQQAVHLKFQKEYEQKKQALGKIVCHQCNWTGNWGEGMSYEEFFVYELVQVHQCQVSTNVDTNLHYLNSETQYRCPMCKSPNWQKV